MLLLLSLALGGCTPRAETNVLGYLAAQRLGTLQPAGDDIRRGTVVGRVLLSDMPVADVTVVVAERTGQPYVGRTDADGRYRIEQVPPGQYVPAAVGVGYDEVIPYAVTGLPLLVTVYPGRVSEVPAIQMQPHVPDPLPDPLLPAVNLSSTRTYTATSAFPPGAVAQVEALQFQRDGILVDTLRVYQPLAGTGVDPQILLFVVYPSDVDGWEPVSVALAQQGFVVVALSAAAQRGVDLDAHAQDARTALHLALNGDLGIAVDRDAIFALGGSFSSAILHRLLRDEAENFAGWVTLGGISNAYSGTAEFYAGHLEIPEQYRYLIPALGSPQLYPLNFLRYSPVYTAAQLPPTMIIHTAADRVIPIEQAFELEEAIRQASIPIQVYYYEDVSHYLEIDENMTVAGEEMFYRIQDFLTNRRRLRATAP